MQRKDVHVPDPEHLRPAAHPGKRYRLPQPIRERESHGDRGDSSEYGGGDRGDGGEYGGGDRVLQSDGSHAEGMRLSAFIDEFFGNRWADLGRERIRGRIIYEPE